MKVELPSNIEIVSKEELVNKIVIQIPKTKYSIILEQEKNNTYKVSIFDRYGHERKMVSRGVSEEKAAIIIEHAAKPIMRKSNKLKEIIKEFKSLINNN